ncbi:MAG TPA: hypothetical protein VGY58_13215 [Gemmataceae bacterium]|jgi:hypothetical protein|nr:hypothetical protein [Gemmataceae bacterium]
MKSLLWKECHENLKWVAIPLLLYAAPIGLLGHPPFLAEETLLLYNILAAVFAAALGFVQVFFESQGDRRALLLHRPLSHSHIFLAKTIAGLGLYLVALGIPFAWEVRWSATPGHVAAPFRWAMTLPWLADLLAGVVYYFAGMLMAQREGRWYGSRGLGLAAAFFCSFLVWALPEFWQALLAIVLFGALVATAAWGSFLTGGAYAPQPRFARAALALTMLTGLMALSATTKLIVGAWFEDPNRYWYALDRTGRMLIEHRVYAEWNLTDLAGRPLPELEGKPLDQRAIQEIEAPVTTNPKARFRSYRNPGCWRVPYFNDSSSGGERWFYVADQGRLLGYDRSKRLIGSIGPDGFAARDQAARERFSGALPFEPTTPFDARSPAYLDFSGRVYTVDFAQRTVKTLFTPAEGQKVLWAVRWKDENPKVALAVVATDQSIEVVDEAGAPVFSALRAYDRDMYGDVRFARLDHPRRYVLWYQPSLHLGVAAAKTMPHYLVEYDADGHGIARRTVPHAPLVEPTYAMALFGLITPPIEASVLVEVPRFVIASIGVQSRPEISPLPFLMFMATQVFIPGESPHSGTTAGPVFVYKGWIALSALVCALVCFVLARRHAFSGARQFGWFLGGLLFGPAGLLLMLALQDWPARIPCPNCLKLRVVTRDICEHCGSAHAAPAQDGTEIFELTPAPLRESPIVPSYV